MTFCQPNQGGQPGANREARTVPGSCLAPRAERQPLVLGRGTSRRGA